MPSSSSLARRGLVLALLLILLISGCDTTGGEETIVLTQGSSDEVELQFEFDPADHSTGSTFTLVAQPVSQSKGTLGQQITAYLRDEGAGAVVGDLLTAELARAELVLGLPPGEDWDFADSAILQVRAGNGEVTDIAQATSLPGDDEVVLDELDRELASILRQSNPQLQLRLTPNSLLQDEPAYTIRANLRFRFEVPLSAGAGGQTPLRRGHLAEGFLPRTGGSGEAVVDVLWVRLCVRMTSAAALWRL